MELGLGGEAGEWLRGRGLDTSLLQDRGWRSAEAATEIAMVAEIAERCGVRLWKGWPFLRRCLMAPLWDVDGRAVSLRGRFFPDPPWLTLPGDDARLLGEDAFGAPPDTVIHVVEGETDRESLQLAGALAAVGVPGVSACHAELGRRILKGGFSRVATWFDGDKAGRKGAALLRDHLAECGFHGHYVRAKPRTGSDVNDWWKGDGRDLSETIEAVESSFPPLEVRT